MPRLSTLLLRLLMTLGIWTGLPLCAQMAAFRTYDHRDGLPHSQVLSLLEDRDGFLWIGCVDGIARLGPRGFTIFGRPKGAPSYAAQTLMEDSRGSIWAVATTSGIAEIRGSQLMPRLTREGRALDTVFALTEGPDGVIYAGTRKGLFAFRDQAFEPVVLPEAWKDKAILSLARDDQGRLWIGGVRRLAYLRQGVLQETPLPESAREERITAIAHQPGIGLWAMSPRMLLHQPPGGTWTRVDVDRRENNLRLRTLDVSPKGELVLALGPGGVLIRRPGGTYEALRPGQEIPRHSVQCVLRDRRGTLWIGTDGGGLLSQSPIGLRLETQDPVSHSPLAPSTAFLELAPGRILMATPMGLTLWEEPRGIVRHWGEKEGMPGGETWSLVPDGKGGAWLCSSEGIAHWQASGVRRMCRELDRLFPVSMAAHAGRLWVLVDRGLAELEPTGRLVRIIPFPASVVPGSGTTLLPLPEGLYIGTNAGLHRFRPGDAAITEAPAPSAGPRIINALNPGRHHDLWVSTNLGVYQYSPRDAGAWTGPLGESDFLKGEVMWTCPLPGDGLAVGLNRGVAILRHGTVLPITRNLGLPTDETNQGAVLLDSRKALWFGLSTGFCRLDLEELPQPPPLPPPRITEALWQGGSLWRPEALDLPASFGTLTLSYDTPLPGAAHPPTYQIWLQGVHRTWTALDPNTSTIQLAALPSGRHRLRLRATLDGQMWSEAAAVEIRVRKAWHEWWTVRFLGLLTLLAGTALLLRLRTRSLERRAQMLQAAVDSRTAELSLQNRSLERLHLQLKRNLESRVQLMNTVSHDLRSPLTSIMLIAGRLRERLDAYAGADASLSVLEREAERLESIVSNLLDRSHSESLTDSLNQRLCRPTEILVGLSDTLRLRAEGNGLGSQQELDPHSLEVWILADVTALQQVLFNLVENALKFTEPPGFVGLRTRVAGEFFQFEVWDTGRGIPPEKLPTLFQPFVQTEAGDARQGWGLGLSICRSMVEAHSGRIEVESRVSEGSTFRVSIPLVLTGDRRGSV